MFRESQALTKGIFALERNEGLFIHTVKRRGPYDRSHGLATSRDFKQWKDYGLIFHADELDQKLGHMRIKAYLGDRQPWLDVSRLDSGAYDTKVMLPPSAPVVRGPGCLGGADELTSDQL